MIFFILPAFNEELNIPTLLNNFNNFFIKNKSFSNIKVVVVDDGSKDNTKKILTKINREKKIFENELSFELINIFHETNRGLGGAIKTGMTYCFNNGNDEDIIITMDCDNSHTIDLCKEMINVLLEGNDVVIASRYKKNSGIKGLSFYRKFLSDLGSLIFKISFPIKNVKDYTCGYRAFRLKKIKEAWKNDEYFFSEKGFTVSLDIILKLFKFNRDIKMQEVPMVLRYDLKKGVSKMAVIKTIFQTINLLFIRKFF